MRISASKNYIETTTWNKDLKEGDSLYFDSSKPHGMQNADDQPCQFITIIL